ncbi:spermidine/putrescine transport system ATP-binding protein [Gemmobacter aquatilis]|uniref:Spermidine/putrescine import ATP-binding protein PotA n=1 Tax=Gemmobacter aquatilis TaxID=933059 RepID=A0A1H7YHC3_9RHOB|nr:ABC transporter ATP-binding protein [Gemmobacter aquatilis]SEM45375.1 spermidine/putrescine transport system ATP-binding protein [Gemmobacter aquatilis]
MSQTNAIEARHTIKAFGQGDSAHRALDDVSITIRKGEFFTLLGPSGCGKTTLLRLIAGFEMPTAGDILIDGAEVTDLPPNKRPVNTVFQSYALFPHLTVAENVGFALKMLGRPKAEVAEVTARMLALVKLEHLAGRKTAQLSGGQQQRVALARALAPHPKVLLLDEPLSALDLKLRKEMQVELKRLQMETGITFVFVTHDQEEALTMSDRIGVMSAGKLQQVGSPREIYTRPVNRFVASFIGETNFLPAKPVAGGVKLGCGAVVEAEGEGHTLTVRPEQLRLVAANEPGAIAATVENLVYFGTDTHLNLRLSDGEALVARVQSPPTGDAGFAMGQAVGVTFLPGAARLIRD